MFICLHKPLRPQVFHRFPIIIKRLAHDPDLPDCIAPRLWEGYGNGNLPIIPISQVDGIIMLPVVKSMGFALVCQGFLCAVTRIVIVCEAPSPFHS